MEVKAKARFIRMSPRKIRLVVDVVRGLPVSQALTQLKFMKKHAALPVTKLLDSAIANAEHNFKMKKEHLFIKSITADGGPTLHRWTPRAHGRATAIRKRTTHISLVLDQVPESKKKEATSDKKAPAAKPEKKTETKTSTETKVSKPTAKK